MVRFLEFLGCAAVFGYAARFVVLPLGVLFLNWRNMRRIQAPVRRFGRERAAELLTGAPDDPGLVALKEEIRAAAERGCRSMGRAALVLGIAPWVVGAAASWLVFFG